MLIKGFCDEAVLKDGVVRLVISPFFEKGLKFISARYADHMDKHKDARLLFDEADSIIRTMVPKYWIDKKLSQDLTKSDDNVIIPVRIFRLLKNETKFVTYIITNSFNKDKEEKLLSIDKDNDDCTITKYDAKAEHDVDSLSFVFTFKDKDFSKSIWSSMVRPLFME